jgi:N-acetylglucosamine kinase-like BadF-type ATPase
MIAVVYSGSRFADWKLSDKGEIVSNFKTAGINPFFSDEKAITQLLNKTNELIYHAEEIKKIYFFGAGAFSKSTQQTIETAFDKFFRYGKATVEHDLKAAAIATCQDLPGIVGILGSGSNAAYFNGKKIKENNYGLGYILGDEGSANWMGRILLRDLLVGDLPKNFEKSFYEKYTLDKKQILDKVYKQSYPALFLSSFADFLLEQQKEEYVYNVVISGFELFFQTYIAPLKKQYSSVPLHFAGTIAAGFEPWLKDVAKKYDYIISSIVEEPIYNVLNYYSNKN